MGSVTNPVGGLGAHTPYICFDLENIWFCGMNFLYIFYSYTGPLETLGFDGMGRREGL